MMKDKHISHYKQTHCSPFRKRLPYSCLSHKALLKVLQALNNIKGIRITHKGLDDKQLYHNVCDVIHSNFNCNTFISKSSNFILSV